MKKTAKIAFKDSLPVLAGYLVLGFGFGIMLKAGGYGILLSFVMALTVYAGSGQYLAVGLLTGGASLFTAALTTFMVNARHIFYGITMLDRYKKLGLRRFYLFFALTDETYSLVSRDELGVEEDQKPDYYLLLTLFDHFYWICGCVLGTVVGTLVKFDSRGIDFVLTALFVTLFIEQWMSAGKHLPALIGVFSTVVSLVIFGKDNMLIPAMILIALLLCFMKEGDSND